MTREQPPQRTREVIRQGLVQAVLLTGALMLVNRYMRDLALDASLWRSIRFAVPFTMVYSVITFAMHRPRAG